MSLPIQEIPPNLLEPGYWRRRRQALRTRIKTHLDAGLHGLRHTFLTEAGEYTDPSTLQYASGHDTISTARLPRAG